MEKKIPEIKSKVARKHFNIQIKKFNFDAKFKITIRFWYTFICASHSFTMNFNAFLTLFLIMRVVTSFESDEHKTINLYTNNANISSYILIREYCCIDVQQTCKSLERFLKFFVEKANQTPKSSSPYSRVFDMFFC